MPPSPPMIHEYLDDFVQFYILSTPDRDIYILYIYDFLYICSVYKYIHVHNMLFIELSTYIYICVIVCRKFNALQVRSNDNKAKHAETGPTPSVTGSSVITK